MSEKHGTECVPELDVYDHDVKTGPDYYREADDSGHRKNHLYYSCSWVARRAGRGGRGSGDRHGI